MLSVPFSPPDITESDIQAVAETLRSGWITTGPKTKEFEKRIARYCEAAGAAALNSQTACAEMTLRALGIGPGDEVIVPAYTYTATASVVCHTGASPVIVDCAPGSYEMDPEKLARAITPATKAVMPVDIAGIPCDYPAVYAAVSSSKGFTPSNAMQEAFGRPVVVADTAHSLGASLGGVRTGGLADFSCFSFHAVKNLTTAEGGAAVWRASNAVDDSELYRTYMLLSLHGQTKDALAKTAGGWEYDIVAPYYKCNLTDIAAAVGLSQLDRYDEMVSRRHEIIDFYNASFADLDVITPVHSREGMRSSGHLYMIRIPGAGLEERQTVYERMAEAGVMCNVHYKPLPCLTAYRNMGFDPADYPNAFAMFENELTLPLYSILTDEQVAHVAGTLRDAVDRAV